MNRTMWKFNLHTLEPCIYPQYFIVANIFSLKLHFLLIVGVKTLPFFRFGPIPNFSEVQWPCEKTISVALLHGSGVLEWRRWQNKVQTNSQKKKKIWLLCWPCDETKGTIWLCQTGCSVKCMKWKWKIFSTGDNDNSTFTFLKPMIKLLLYKCKMQIRHAATFCTTLFIQPYEVI